ncbi:DmsC/YnfH family molybdoenzyme membrane anchor subunit [Shimia thalassica]|uniref:dimethyl sulfoxide reductase anchor subunit family protein n=1 Tax=Shimia thalassica TaxID=1715693 RepID=UPI002732D906|nr:DmsC/YnfH family molybdoenzyme membrane anchor subunit [Shimia thalassica]MDP2578916.1 DmsC/YnfH family molybdoenzyme membrane anchor subunit [Shimia thalassica]
MHPARSIILFTTLSGLGFGLLAWLGVDRSPPTGWVAFVFFAIAYALAVGGLLASTFHLGRPERAWRAFSQWKTSWLSREGICAVATLLVMAVYGAALVFADMYLPALGLLGALLALSTVFTTSMIYGQLQTVPRWNSALTPLLFLTLSVTGGALLSGRVAVATILLIVAGLVQILWWRKGDKAFEERGHTMGTATGLGQEGEVRSMAHPHTSPNYLMREMMYVVGRKHAQKLRVTALLLMSVVPAILLALPVPHLFGLLAVLSHIAGVAASRWLFFAEAEHVVGLYYGAR